MIRATDLQMLAQHTSDLCISLFMPLSPANWRHDQTQLRSLIRSATATAIEAGHREADVKKLLESTEHLVTSPTFWQQRGSGLALFVSEGFLRPWALETEPAQRAFVDHHFHMAPLLSSVHHYHSFYALTLSHKRVQLYRGDGGSLVPCDNIALPNGIKEALWFKDTEKPSLRGSATAVGGIGGDSKQPHADEKEYVRHVNRVVSEYLQKVTAPLILVGLQPMLSLYRSANTYPNLYVHHIERNPDTTSPHELYHTACELIAELEQTPIDEAQNSYIALSATDTSRIASEPLEILRAAQQGRIGTLLVGSGELSHAFGEELASSMDGPPTIEKAADSDMAEAAIRETVLRGGKVYAVPDDQLPSYGSPLAAIMRY